MGEASSTEKAPKKHFFRGVKTEFNKISWPDKETITKHTVAVIGISVVVGLIITLFDTIIQFGIKFLAM
jgi:preprotein translocase subunit SecE